MTFEIHSDITNRSMTIASRAMRKVLRRKRSILWAIFDWSVFFINALLLIPFDGEPFTLDAGTVISLLVEVMLLSVLLFQDRLNGMIACKNTLAGTKDYHIAFGEESYIGLCLAYFHVVWKQEGCYYCSEFVGELLTKSRVDGTEQLRSSIIQPMQFLRVPHTLLYCGKLREYVSDTCSEGICEDATNRTVHRRLP